MRKVTLRRHLWLCLAVVAVVIAVAAAYLLTRTLPGAKPYVIHPPKYDVSGEIKRAKASPEWAELTKLLARENQPLTRAGLERAGQLTTHPNFIIRMTALGVLALAPDTLKPEATALVAARMKDENDLVRTEAMDVLGRLGAQQYVPELLAFLDSPESRDRYAARRALERLGHPVE
jgi:HEAT repeat protein